LPVKKDLKLDLEKLKKKEYTLDDLLEFANSNLGKYEDQDLFLRIGKYGNYVEWGENKKSISDIGIPLININLDDIKQFLSKKEVDTDDALTSTVQTEFSRDAHPCNKTILRQLNKDFSIRKGKYGQYIYHKSSKMKNPDFYNIKDFTKTMDNSTSTNVNPLLCNAQLVIDWVIKTYHIIQ
jgi:topoisomerase IA-like protein